MSLNPSRGNMYEWVTHTWNPANGRCEHDCSYCYVKRGRSGGWSHDIKLMRAIDDSLGEGKTIFVCSQTDLFGEWVPREIIERVLEQCRKYPLNRYLFQSKNPARFLEFMNDMPEDRVFCTTIETNRAMDDISTAPNVTQRFKAMCALKEAGNLTSVTIEPIIDFDVDEMLEGMKALNADWISIGADSKGSGLPEPPKDKVVDLIRGMMRAGIKIEQKRNLDRMLRGVKL